MELIEKIVLDAEKNVCNTNYFKDKGYGNKTILRHRLGYLKDGLLPYADEIDEDRMILACYKYVIPNYDFENKLTYLIIRRDEVSMKEQLPFEIDKTFILGNFKNNIWNAKDLNNEQCVFVCETWTDAISIIDCGYNAIALNKINNIVDLWKCIKFYNLIHKKYILFCDNDYYGKKTNNNLSKMMESQKCEYIVLNSFPERIKDANEWYIYDKNSFMKMLGDGISGICKNVK
ncbi:toprim domain-containing protein [Intestinibacter bartlettii]|uniref:toprim domain-containing protein n=1 Tax=Intestinibacter bartlettii TaxID=261299 RepID=UPI0022DED361|nr:toprim domain-containing protein [Intestinibacter bartlettii]